MSVKSRRCHWWAGTIISAAAALPVFANTSERGLRIRHYEVAQAIEQVGSATPASHAGRDHRSLTLRFQAYGRQYSLDLQPNERLMSAVDGSDIRLYEGSLHGVSPSWARISMTSGSIRGIFWDGRELYLVDSAGVLGAERAATLPAMQPVIYRLADALGTQNAAASGAVDYGALSHEMDRTPLPLQGANFRIDVSALGDAAFRARYASDREAQEEILTRLNNVDGIFTAQLGVQIEVSLVDVAADATAALTPSSDASVLLRQVAGLRLQQAKLNSRALTFLFTGRKLDGDRVGLAYTGALCSPVYSAALAQTSANSGLDSLIAAHEIAHVLGAPHDGEKQCASTPRSRFLMTPALISSESVFSSCSVASMRPQIDGGSCVVALHGADAPADRRFAGTESESAETDALTLQSERTQDDVPAVRE